MKGEKLLAEWLWIDRWMGSSAFLLPMETRGLYREMLTQAWRRGARLPNDHEAIQRATGCTAEEWARCWPRLARYWREDGDSLVNDTQISVYAETVAARERASERGRKGAQATAQARAQAGAQVQAQAVPEHPLKHQPPSPSPSPSVTLEVGREVVAPPRYEPTRLPADKAENEVTEEIRRLQNVLGAKLAMLWEHPNNRDEQGMALMVPAWTRKVTAYKRKDGVSVSGVADYRTIRSIERLEKSIQDADWWLEKLGRDEMPEVQRGA